MAYEYSSSSPESVHHDPELLASVPHMGMWSVEKRSLQEHISLIDSFSYIFSEQEKDTCALPEMQNYWDYCKALSNEYLEYHQDPESTKHFIFSSNSAQARQVNALLFSNDFEAYFSLSQLSNAIKVCWDTIEHVSLLVHKPTFDTELCDPLLAATLVYIGVATRPHVNRLAETKRMYASLVGKAEQAFRSKRHHTATSENLELYQTLTFLAFYDYSLLADQEYENRINLTDIRKDLEAYMMLGGELHDKSSCERPLGNAHMNSEAYVFFAGGDPQEQWVTWARHEALVRLGHFVKMTSITHLFACHHPGFPYASLSVTDYDHVMIGPSSHWTASSPGMFFHILGPSRSIPTISFLLVMKCMLRLPSLSEHGARRYDLSMNKGQSGWTLHHLYIIILGITIVGWIVEGCRFYHQIHEQHTLLAKNKENTLQGGNSSQPAEKPKKKRTIFSAHGGSSIFIDKQVKNRLFFSFRRFAEFCESASYDYLKLPFHETPNNNLPSFLWENVPTICAYDIHMCLCLYFQTSYFSIYHDEEQFEHKLLDTVSENLVTLAEDEQLKAAVKGWTAFQLEVFIMYGTLYPDASQVKIITDWASKDATSSRLFFATYYLLTMIKSTTPARLAGAEIVYARALLAPNSLLIWAFNFQQRYTASNFTPIEVERTPYYQQCLDDSQKIDPTPLLAQHFTAAQEVWKRTRGQYVNPYEKELTGLNSLLSRHRITPSNAVSAAQAGSNSTAAENNDGLADGELSLSSLPATQSGFQQCNIFSWFAFIVWADEVKFKLCTSTTQNDLVSRIKAALL